MCVYACVLGGVGLAVASLVSTHQMPVAPPHSLSLPQGLTTKMPPDSVKYPMAAKSSLVKQQQPEGGVQDASNTGRTAAQMAHRRGKVLAVGQIPRSPDTVISYAREAGKGKRKEVSC